MKKVEVYILYGLLLMVYISGLFIPLMENDSAQHATMAMRMYLENDFWNIYVGTSDYLDKPHMHFWLSALAFKVFGVSHFSYRIPALIFTLLGAVYTNRLVVLFYGKKVKHIGALVFLSVQAIFLANHDVRTDAVLTGATIISLFYFIKFLNKTKVKDLVLGFFALAIAFSCKGQLAFFVVGVCVSVYIVQYKLWKHIFSWKVILGFVCYFVFISPVLYAYYLQFDLHPEKVIQGQNNISGVKFILWDQSFNRLTANGYKATSPDYFFFFHTLLWAFLPWSLFYYRGIIKTIRMFFIKEKQTNKGFELTSFLGVLIVLLVISTSKFKLPHYLNSLFPLMSVFVTGQLSTFFEKENIKYLRKWLNAHIIIFVILSIFVIFISFWAFPYENSLILVVPVIFGFLIIWYLNKKNIPVINKFVTATIAFMVLINLILNIQFYPNLLNYQSGQIASKVLKQKEIDVDKIKLSNGTKSWSLCFYLNRILDHIDVKNIQPDNWVYMSEKEYNTLLEDGVEKKESYELIHYRITRLKPKFINPNTRDEVLSKRYLVHW